MQTFMSLAGNILSQPLWVNASGSANPNVQIWNMIQGTPSGSPVSSVSTSNVPALNNPNLKILAQGDFFGDGFASPLLFNSAANTLGLWVEPLNPNSAIASGSTLRSLLPDRI